MFTLKFMNFYEGNRSLQNILCCPHYQIYLYEDGNCEVTVYKNHLSVEGVSYWVGDREGVHAYHVCYIENEAGKTIDRLGNPIK